VVMEIRIREYFRGEIEADAGVAGTVESGQDVSTATNVRLLQELGGSSIQTTKHTAVTSPMTNQQPTYVPISTGPFLPFNGKCGLRKDSILRFLLRDNQIAFWHL
jgi:hypothetical protein